jgi:multidrug efflux pump subunit AcrB
MSAKPFKSYGLIGVFARHKVAANLLMMLMLILGIVALFKLNVQFFPNFNLDYAQVRVIWPGANAQDVEKSVTDPIERVLRNIENLDEMTSTSSLGASLVTLKFLEGTDMIEAVDQVRQRVSELRNLPQDIQTPVVERIIRYEPVAKILVLGQDGEEAQLRRLVRQYERELLDRGIDKVDFRGRPLEEMAIELDSRTLANQDLTLGEVANRVSAQSRDVPAGRFGDQDASRDIRAIEQARDEQSFEQLGLRIGQTENLRLGDVAEVTLRPQKDSAYLKVDGRPAIEMALQRAESGDTLKSSQIMQAWLLETQPQLPQGVELRVYDETWSLVKDRIMLLVSNGIGGLILVLLVLYFFLNGRVAFWVALGIPISFMATLMVLYSAGGSINMMSLFALIMALGIIVDDAIVVGEDTLTHHEMGEPPLEAAEGGAHRMFTPVMASSLTTIAAFLPLMLIGAEIGAILFAIPMVIVAVILVSLVQCFLVLPGHLRFGLGLFKAKKEARWRERWDNAFNHFRQSQFRSVIRWVLKNRGSSLALALALIIFTIGLLAGGRLSFTFFPSPESNRVVASIQFVAGTSEQQTAKFMDRAYQALIETEKELEPGLVDTAVVAYNQGSGSSGSVYGQITVELIDADRRHTRNAEFIRVWKQKTGEAPGLENFNIVSQTGGPPGRDIQVQFTGSTPENLKQASLALQQALAEIPGVSGLSDDLPYGREQMVFELTPQGQALGFNYTELGAQLSAAFSGRLAQIFTLGEDEIEVRVMLPRDQQQQLAVLNELQVVSPTGVRVPLGNVVTWKMQQGFDVMRHYNGQLAVTVLGDVDRSVNNANQILQDLQAGLLPDLMDKYGVRYSLEGTAKNQQKTFGDMMAGLVIGIVLIYLILAWVFESYGWPLIVMTAIPLGLIGAILGHYFMGVGLTILSMFGFFGLAGIVVNNSIILVSFYKRLREEGMAVNEALEEASVQRLRAVLVTSLTTIGGLTPLLFETSLQAQFLIPMAVSIAFGLMFATLLILLVLPALLSLYEGVAKKISYKLQSVKVT